jgi:hypothetical protein
MLRKRILNRLSRKRGLPTASSGAKYLKNSREFPLHAFETRRKTTGSAVSTVATMLGYTLMRDIMTEHVRRTHPKVLPPLVCIVISPLFTLRPPTNDRTCMGWHTRHASLCGAGGTFSSRDAKPYGLESCLGTQLNLHKMKNRIDFGGKLSTRAPLPQHRLIRRLVRECTCAR